MVTRLTLSVVLDDVINPNARKELDELLALVSTPGNGVSLELRQETALISLPEIEVFVATQLPADTDPKRVRAVARQFYIKLPHWSQILPLRFSCPHCYCSRGGCRCARMGWSDHYRNYRDRDNQLAAG